MSYIGRPFVVTLSLLLARCGMAHAEGGSDTGQRRLWDETFKKSRVESARQDPRPRPSGKPPAAHAKEANEAFVGITLWRLRPAAPRDRDAGLVLFRSDRHELVAERMDPTKKLAVGDKIRLGIESARAGHLYVLDRERYADGSAGQAYLISPTTRLRDGRSAVTAGRVVEVPAFSDQPPFFVIEPSRVDQVAEELIVLVTEAPLPNVTIGPKPVPISAETLASWEKAASSQQVSIAHAPPTAVTGYIQAEREAAGESERLLTHQDPLPQTIYRVVARPDEPVMVRLLLELPR